MVSGKLVTGKGKQDHHDQNKKSLDKEAEGRSKSTVSETKGKCLKDTFGKTQDETDSPCLLILMLDKLPIAWVDSSEEAI